LKVHKQLQVRILGPPPRSGHRGKAHKQSSSPGRASVYGTEGSRFDPDPCIKPAFQLGRFELFLGTSRCPSTDPSVMPRTRRRGCSLERDTLPDMARGGPPTFQVGYQHDSTPRLSREAPVECLQAPAWFDSRVRHREAASTVRLTRKVAQSVERIPAKDEVAGSIPALANKHQPSHSAASPLLRSASPRPASQALVGSSPTFPTTSGK
jgi:hypothetical protein